MNVNVIIEVNRLKLVANNLEGIESIGIVSSSATIGGVEVPFMVTFVTMLTFVLAVTQEQILQIGGINDSVVGGNNALVIILKRILSIYVLASSLQSDSGYPSVVGVGLECRQTIFGI